LLPRFEDTDFGATVFLSIVNAFVFRKSSCEAQLLAEIGASLFFAAGVRIALLAGLGALRRHRVLFELSLVDRLDQLNPIALSAAPYVVIVLRVDRLALRVSFLT